MALKLNINGSSGDLEVLDSSNNILKIDTNGNVTINNLTLSDVFSENPNASFKFHDQTIKIDSTGKINLDLSVNNVKISFDASIEHNAIKVNSIKASAPIVTVKAPGPLGLALGGTANGNFKWDSEGAAFSADLNIKLFNKDVFGITEGSWGGEFIDLVKKSPLGQLFTSQHEFYKAVVDGTTQYTSYAQYLAAHNAQISDELPSLFDQIAGWRQRVDPLILDLDGDGIETVNVDAGVVFDHDADGLKQGTGWVSADDGLLAYDRNGNGIIDSGYELFGDQTPGPRAINIGIPYNGFHALSPFDENRDGLVDANDSGFINLKVWQDINQDGISQSSELFTLQELGITAIDLSSVQHEPRSDNGNEIEYSASFTRNDEEYQVGMVNYETNTFNSKFVDPIPLVDGVLSLPYVEGSGGLRNLHEAMSLRPELLEAVQSFSSATTAKEQKELLYNLIAEWAKTSTIRPAYGDFTNNILNSIINEQDEQDEQALNAVFEGLRETPLPLPGETVLGSAFDSRVAILESFMGADSNMTRVDHQIGGSGTSTFRSFTTWAQTQISEAFQELESSIYKSLVLQTRLKPYTDSIKLIFSEEGEVIWDTTELVNMIDGKFVNDEFNALADLIELTKYFGEQLHSMNFNPEIHLGMLLNIASIDEEVLLRFDDFGIDQSTSSDGGFMLGGLDSDILLGMSGNDYIYGLSNGDTISVGRGNDTADGGAGDDLLQGDSASQSYTETNTFIGGTGNDRMEGHSSADTYLYNLGDGNDVINDKDLGYSQIDKLIFGEGISQEDIVLRREGDHLVVLVTDPTTQAASNITIENAVTNSLYRLEEMHFADGTVISGDWLNIFNLVGTDAADNILGTSASETILGFEGDDELSSGRGNDTLDGGAGDDLLQGDSASQSYTETNTFIGGTGNDRIEGYSSADTYLYNLGDGNDVINDKDLGYSQIDKLIFGEGINQSDVSLRADGVNLIVQITDPITSMVSKITIEEAITNSYNTIEVMKFADGSTIEGDLGAQFGIEEHSTQNKNKPIIESLTSQFELLVHSMNQFEEDGVDSFEKSINFNEKIYLSTIE